MPDNDFRNIVTGCCRDAGLEIGTFVVRDESILDCLAAGGPDAAPIGSSVIQRAAWNLTRWLGVDVAGVRLPGGTIRFTGPGLRA